MLTKFRQEKRAAFIPFVVAGDPNLPATGKMIDVLVAEGADLIELGVPFSDALADGPVIQAASERAAKTTTLSSVLDFAKTVHQRHPHVPLIIFTYYNPIFKMGIQAFAKMAMASGVSGVLVVDLPPEQAVDYLQALEKSGLKSIFLASPTTSVERLRLIAKASTGFIYYVSRTGVTGEQKELSETLAVELEGLRKVTDQPVAIGFGISTGAHAAIVSRLGDAVVVGSAFVRIIADNDPVEVMEKKVRTLAREIVGGFRK